MPKKKINVGNIKSSIGIISEKSNNFKYGYNLKTISIDELVEHEKNSKLFRELNEKEFDELKSSIKELGLLEPLSVIKIGDKYKIISGHQRKKALEELGINKVAVNVITIDEDYEELAIIHANIKQRKLKDIELAELIKIEKEFVRKKNKENNISGNVINEISINLEMSKDKVKRLDRLNRLIPEIQDLVREGKLKTGKAQDIAVLDKDFQKFIYKKFGDDIEKFSLDEIKHIKKQIENNKKLKDDLKNSEIESKEDFLNKISELKKESDLLIFFKENNINVTQKEKILITKINSVLNSSSEKILLNLLNKLK